MLGIQQRIAEIGRGSAMIYLYLLLAEIYSSEMVSETMKVHSLSFIFVRKLLNNYKMCLMASRELRDRRLARSLLR